MAQIPQHTTNNVEEILANAGGSSVLIPDSDYTSVIVESIIKDTAKGGKYIQLKEVITEGPHQNVELIERLNIVNDNPQTVKIAYETLARIAKAVGMSTLPTDTNQLHNKKHKIRTKTEQGQDWVNNEGVTVEGKPRSVIDSKGYASLPAVGSVSLDVPFEGGNTQTPASPDKMPWEN